MRVLVSCLSTPRSTVYSLPSTAFPAYFPRQYGVRYRLAEKLNRNYGFLARIGQ